MILWYTLKRCFSSWSRSRRNRWTSRLRNRSRPSPAGASSCRTGRNRRWTIRRGTRWRPSRAGACSAAARATVRRRSWAVVTGVATAWPRSVTSSTRTCQKRNHAGGYSSLYYVHVVNNAIGANFTSVSIRVIIGLFS